MTKSRAAWRSSPILQLAEHAFDDVSALIGGAIKRVWRAPRDGGGNGRPGARLEGHVATLKARLAAAEAVGGAEDCQAGEGSRQVLGARGPATSALVAAAHGLR